ncbi:hypothetical protein Vc3S01_1390 [Vibrio campbellii]|nr:hypothetical protein Vc3S01_1390 [Vibrio campbellii]
MSRLIKIIAGGLLGAVFVILAAYLIGSLFGPLYNSEDESARNFKLFLLILVGGIGAGALLVHRCTSKHNKAFKSGS